MEESKDKTVTIRLVIGRRELVGALVAALVLAHPAGLATEQLTMTTYYPSPYGVYQRLRSTQDAYLATDPSASPQRRVGIGTATPARKLDVAGDMQASDLYTTDGVQIQGLSGRNYFRDAEGAGNLRVGAAWGMPGVYAETGVGVLGGASGASLQNNTLFASPGGNVGIATASPGYRLDIAGDTRVQGNLYLSGPIQNMCRSVWFSFGTNTSCPWSWAVTGTLVIGNPPPPYGHTSGIMICCKLVPNG
ncbi:MAG: hypothetical protein FD126_1050 [Elusimicrobia bacterium]|nr:MAG: hypothetical protein FD126_1050 [Elusimicrobiota bacterium]